MSTIPTPHAIQQIPGVDLDTANAVYCVLAEGSGNHEARIAACDKLLDTCGVESIGLDDETYYTDEGIALCPRYSYCNTGDTYAPTLVRDHKHCMWLIACWGDLVEEFEREHES